MIKIEKIKKLLECITLTGFIKGERPLSAVLIGKPETGKSSLILLLRNYHNTTYHNDLSFKGLIDLLLPKIERGETTHILIPDFINVLSHRRAADSLIPALNSMMEEGIKDLKFYGTDKVFSKSVQGGLITGLTKEVFDGKIQSWKNIGFLTRMIIISYGYTELTKIAIHQHIREGKPLNNNSEIHFDASIHKTRSIEISIPTDIAQQIEFIAMTVLNQTKNYLIWFEGKKYSMNLEKYGFRLHLQMRILAKAIALYNGNKEVTINDVAELTEFTTFMNFNFTEV